MLLVSSEMCECILLLITVFTPTYAVTDLLILISFNYNSVLLN
jgi:hypothetical protein